MKTKLEEIEKIIEKRGEFTVLDGAAKSLYHLLPMMIADTLFARITLWTTTMI